MSSDQAHYTHERISGMLQIPFEKVKSDQYGRMSLLDLKSKLKQGDIGTVVCTMGTTGLGAVDPLADLLKLRQEYGLESI